MIIDTDVIIWYLRGNSKAQRVLQQHRNFSLSVVSYIELVQGMRNLDELRRFKDTLRNWDTKVIQIDDEISSQAMFLVERYYLSRRLQLADALIAATVMSRQETLLSGNTKHFAMISELKLKAFSP